VTFYTAPAKKWNPNRPIVIIENGNTIRLIIPQQIWKTKGI